MAPSAQPVTPVAHHCPACGQRMTPTPSLHCPSCDFDLCFDDQRVTSDDVTPYARAYARDEPGWRRMSEWIWYAGAERMKHLALIRASAASRRFAWLNLLLLLTGVGLIQTTRVGWEWMTDSPALQSSGNVKPAGRGWIHLAQTPRPLPLNLPPEAPVDLWWSPPQMMVGVVVGSVAAMILIWLAHGLIRTGLRWAHLPPYRHEQRMTGALQYSIAWSLPLWLAALLLSLRPLSYMGDIARWRWVPPLDGFHHAAGALAGFGLVMWWFWLVRLAAVAPVKTRGRVTAFVALGVPMIVALTVAAWMWGLDALFDPLFSSLDWQFQVR